uniref:Carnitinyl-CoA dehydratase n=1 Tax=uncultured prokaryote TaxID=198431 RepID=H5SPB6_9ZZZZ|nr:carnitinyl-CoA dehydratase [uncultured prokaryote]
MEGSQILRERRGGIYSITICNPSKNNALTPSILKSLHDEFDYIKEQEDILVVIIRGFGQKAFCSGFDIEMLPQLAAEMTGPDPDNNVFQRAINCLDKLPQVTIAMINGIAFGGGCEIAASCDIRIASENATFAMTASKMGVLYSPSGIKKFIDLIGLSHTNELFYTALPIDAKRALNIGLVNYVVPPDQLESFTYKTAEEILKRAPLVIRGTKRIISILKENPVLSRHHLDEINNLRRLCISSMDFKEAQRAFIEKREPIFTGR